MLIYIKHINLYIFLNITKTNTYETVFSSLKYVNHGIVLIIPKL